MYPVKYKHAKMTAGLYLYGPVYVGYRLLKKDE